MTNITLAPVQPDQPSHLWLLMVAKRSVLFEDEGRILYTADGTEYLDAYRYCCMWFRSCSSCIAEAIAEQAATLVHTSNLFEIPWQTAAAQKLAEVSGMEEIFFSNSGAESNEGAIKIARKFGTQQGISNPKLLLLNNLFMVVLWRPCQQGIRKFKKVLHL
jgi:acetylornithine aminotransferase